MIRITTTATRWDVHRLTFDANQLYVTSHDLLGVITQQRHDQFTAHCAACGEPIGAASPDPWGEPEPRTYANRGNAKSALTRHHERQHPGE